jgi:nucleoside-diphosphate-sugar epimerase
MAYLITGGSGFIGAHTVWLLEEQGEEVVIYDSNPDRKIFARIMVSNRSSGTVVVKGDITDLQHLHDTCKQYHIERIIHTAAIIGSEDPPLTVKINCDGTMNILEVSRLSGIKKVVLSSSVAVFGNIKQYEGGHVLNDAPHYPGTIYGACKSHNEACAAYYFRYYGLDTVAVRFPHVYGIGRKRGFGSILDDELIIKPATGRSGQVPNGEATHNWLYAKDAAKALVMASRTKTTKTRAFTAAGDIRTVTKVADYIRGRVPDADITLLPGGADDGYPYSYDSRPIQQEIGFKPEWTIEDAVMDMIDSIRINNEE